jgi:hypothetical protein
MTRVSMEQKKFPVFNGGPPGRAPKRPAMSLMVKGFHKDKKLVYLAASLQALAAEEYSTCLFDLELSAESSSSSLFCWCRVSLLP